MGVDQRVVAWLRAADHDAVHLRDEGLHRLSDEAIFDKAIAEGRVVLTFNLDFGEIAALAKGRVTSVVLLRLPDARHGRVIERLQAVLPASAEALSSSSAPRARRHPPPPAPPSAAPRSHSGRARRQTAGTVRAPVRRF
jgi:predicted nuclease of predicted toxin-antitoxin system